MSDDQTELLTEIRDIAREHLELYRERSAKAIAMQKRSVRIGLAVMLLVVVGAILAAGIKIERVEQPVGGAPPVVNQQ